jgi:hypothetical protein
MTRVVVQVTELMWGSLNDVIYGSALAKKQTERTAGLMAASAADSAMSIAENGGDSSRDNGGAAAPANTATPTAVPASNEEVKLPPSIFLGMAGDIAKGMKYLHARRFVHRDLKPANSE